MQTDDPDDTGERRRLRDRHPDWHPWRMPLPVLMLDVALFLAGAAVGVGLFIAVLWWLA